MVGPLRGGGGFKPPKPLRKTYFFHQRKKGTKKEYTKYAPLRSRGLYLEIGASPRPSFRVNGKDCRRERPSLSSRVTQPQSSPRESCWKGQLNIISKLRFASFYLYYCIIIIKFFKNVSKKVNFT